MYNCCVKVAKGALQQARAAEVVCKETKGMEVMRKVEPEKLLIDREAKQSKHPITVVNKITLWQNADSKLQNTTCADI